MISATSRMPTTARAFSVTQFFARWVLESAAGDAR